MWAATILNFLVGEKGRNVAVAYAVMQCTFFNFLMLTSRYPPQGKNIKGLVIRE